MPAPPTLEDQSLADVPDAVLLQDFVRRRDEDAFTMLVRRHSGWVQGVAQRALGDGEAARDVAQQVFIFLARKASRLKPDALGPWLHRVTVLECRNAQRRENTRRRSLAALAQQSETMNAQPDADPAWREALPHLDEAVNTLPEADRLLIVQRFFENRSWRDIGESLHRTGDAARMALPAALEKLSRVLVRRGAAVSAAALAGFLATAGKSNAAASSAGMARNALTASAAAQGLRAGGAAWLSAAACLIAGATAGWFFTGTPAETSAQKVPSEAPNQQAAGGPLRGSLAGGAAFDLEKVLTDLRALQPVGNDLELVVRLRAALIEMPRSAVPPVLAAMQKHRWGEESALVAEVFFHRWAALDPEAAWAEIRTPALLGASHKTVPAFFDSLPRGNPAQFVRFANSLPLGERYEQVLYEARPACLRDLPMAELVPHLAALKSPAQRGNLINSRLQPNAFTAADCRLLAPVVASFPTGTGTAQNLATQWAEVDPAAAAAWAASLPTHTPARWAADTGWAYTVSRHDPVAAAKMIANVPWLSHLQTSLESVIVRWIVEDGDSARRWITNEADIPAEVRQRLLKHLDE